MILGMLLNDLETLIAGNELHFKHINLTLADLAKYSYPIFCDYEKSPVGSSLGPKRGPPQPRL